MNKSIVQQTLQQTRRRKRPFNSDHNNICQVNDLANSLNEIYNIKQSIALKLALTLLVVSVFLLPLSIFIWKSAGFHLYYVLHILSVISAVALLIKNNKYSYRAEFAVTITILTLMAVLGTYNFGLNSGAIILLITVAILILIGFSLKLAGIYFVLSLVALVILIMVQINDAILLTQDNLDDASSPALFVYISVLLSSIISCQLVLEYRKKLQNALFVIDKQSQEVSRPVDLYNFCDSLIAEYTDTGRACTLEYNGNEDQVFNCRYISLRRALRNIIDNGLRYGVQVKLTVSQSNTENVLLVLSDKGPGLAEDDLLNVLKPFYRPDKAATFAVG